MPAAIERCEIAPQGQRCWSYGDRASPLAELPGGRKRPGEEQDIAIVREIRLQVGRWAIGVLVALSFAAGAFYLHAIAVVGAGYKAKILCSETFVSGRSPDAVLAEDLKVDGFEFLELFSHEIDRQRPSVTVSLFGLVSQRAIHRDGLGCTLVIRRSEEELRTEAPPFLTRSVLPDAPWPVGRGIEVGPLPAGIDARALAQAVDAAFAEPDPDALQRTRALVVLHQDRIVAERYARGFDAQTPMLGWSMSKTALNALVGIRIRQGKLSLSDRGLVPEWSAAGGLRSQITLDHLLHMSSGLVFSEEYEDMQSDIVVMLFGEGDKSGFAAAKQAEHRPGDHWSYSGGTSNIIARILRSTFRDQHSYLNFPYRELFSRLGMEHAVLEPDASGTFVASSFMYATARDWARLGLLFLRDGVWQGERVLPEGWVAASLRPTRAAPEGIYGAHLWLKMPISRNHGEPPLPEDAYYMLGHDGQIVAVIPSLDLVIVRMGLARKREVWKPAKVLAPIVEAFSRHGE